MKKAEQKQRQQEENEKEFEALKASIQLPPEPAYSFWSGFYSTHGCWLISELMLLSICALGGIDDDEIVFFAILVIAAIVSLMLCIVESSNIYEKKQQEYEEAQRDPDHYKTVEALFQQFHADDNTVRDNVILRCPVCRSVNVSKISAIDRTESAAAVGLASGKTGKQYKCKYCGHMW